MQRWLIFIFCLPLISWGQNANVEVISTELSYWLAGSQMNADTSIINGKANIEFRSLQSSQSLNLEVGALQVKSISLKEGRIKRALPFEHKNGICKVPFETEIYQHIEWQIDFELPYRNDSYSADVFLKKNLMVLNPIASTQEGVGSLAYFFPRFGDDVGVLKLNLSFPVSKTIGFPGKLEFEVTQKGGVQSQFWTSEKAISAKEFYLFVSEFEEEQAKDPDQEFELTSFELDAIRASTAPARMAPALLFFGIEPQSYTDSQLVEIDSLSAGLFTGFFIQGNEPNMGVLAEELNRRKALALYINSNDTALASDLLWKTMTDEKGKEWEEEVLKDKWEKRRYLKTQFQPIVYAWRFDKWKNANPKLVSALDYEQLDTGFLQPFLISQSMYSLSLSYYYVGGDNTFYVSYEQDSTAAPPYIMPIQITVFTSQGVIDTIGIIIKQQGRIEVNCQVAPSGVQVYLGENKLGTYVDVKPDAYLLFQLSKAESKEQRKEALEGLFKTANPNLFSTALGIAMRDEADEIKIMALQNAGDLNIAQQYKLKATIISLSQNNNAEVRELASALVVKYYPDK